MPSNTHLLYEIDEGFNYRIAFLLLAASFFVVRLFFFPQAMATNFYASGSELTPQIAEYLRYRGVYMLLVTAIYSYSYFRDWHFNAVAFVVFELAICCLAEDFVRIYSKFAYGSASATLILLGLVRLAVTVCLFLNTFNSHRAPPLPRRFGRPSKNRPPQAKRPGKPGV